MSTQMVIRIDEEMKTRFGRIVRMEGKAQSTKVKELIRDYVEKNDMEKYVEDLWLRIGKKIRRRFSMKDVPRIIAEVRNGKGKKT